MIRNLLFSSIILLSTAKILAPQPGSYSLLEQSRRSLGLDSLSIKSVALSAMFSSKNLVKNGLEGSSGSSMTTDGTLSLDLMAPDFFRETQRYSLSDGSAFFLRTACRNGEHYLRATKPVSMNDGTHVVMNPRTLSDTDKLAIRADESHLLLALFLSDVQMRGVTSEMSVEAVQDASHTKFEMLDIKTDEGVTRLYFERGTLLPAFLAWKDDGKQMKLYLDTYSSFSGVLLPTHLQFTSDDIKVEEWRNITYNVNQKTIVKECGS
jgi:hypothetical protein